MDRLTLALLTFDVGVPAASPAAFADRVCAQVHEAWDEGADLVVLPEFLWMGLEPFVKEEDKLRGVARLFWNDLWPRISPHLSPADKGVVLGTVPFLGADGQLRNRAPIWDGVAFRHQDKLHLTPWESAFVGGEGVGLWSFRGVRCVVVICLDVEIPELASLLRGQGVELMLVPSATETLMGVERVGRCADARAVELGCHVGVCHLVGRTASVLIDENIGRAAAFAPSQAAFRDEPRHLATPVCTEGDHALTVDVDVALLRRHRATPGETDPSRLSARPLRILS
jgi:predicted amidohydrolase